MSERLQYKIMEPKILTKKHDDTISDNGYDIVIVLPNNFSGSTEHLIIDAKHKFMILSDRQKLENMNLKPIITEVKQKRKRIQR